MKKVFISREQNPDSIFYKTLTKAGFEVIGKSLIEISAVPFSGIPETNWIFFYSKNGVKHFFEQIKAPISSHIKFATIGPGTADFLEEHFAHPNFVGDGNAETTAKSFLKIALGEKVLFPRAKKSQRSVQKWLGKKVKSIDLVVYENSPLTDFELPAFDCLVFTSPMNASAYLGIKEITEQQKIIAIGNTTAQSLSKTYIKNIVTTESPSEASLSKTVIEIY